MRSKDEELPAGQPALGRRTGTATSNFGVSRRENHDASAFYARFEPPELSSETYVEPYKAIDQIFHADARHMADLKDSSVALVVTSPPYFAGKEYEQALGEGAIPADYLDYLQMLEDVFSECVRALEPGGRIAVNVANLGRRPYRSLASDVIGILQDRLRLLLRGEIIWVKARGASGSCAWGSFRSPSNPVLRDLTERVIVASKGRFDRAGTPMDRSKNRLPYEPSIGVDEFMEATTDIWTIPAESAHRVGHPAPFPVELPERLIRQHTFVGDLVLDPFIGAGTTAVAAIRTGRHYVGYDTDPSYVAAAVKRISTEAIAPPIDGRSSVDAAAALLAEAGFSDVRRKPTRLPVRLDVDLEATDATGRRWFVLVGGPQTNLRPGLRRTEETWRVIATATALASASSESRTLVITSSLPTPTTPAARALAEVTGVDRPLLAAIELGSALDLETLRSVASGEVSGAAPRLPVPRKRRV